MTDWAVALEATWPPARTWRVGPFRLRDGAGGGKRVSAASVEGAWSAAELVAAEAAMGEPLFSLRPEDGALDAALAARGYRVVDPVVAMAGRVGDFAAPDHFTAFPHWPPLQVVRDLWAEAGIGPARVAVMERVEGPKVALLARVEDRPSGAAFVACHGAVAMLHALEIRPAFRRKGCGANLLRAAAKWAEAEGAETLALVVTEANAGARALYASLGMRDVGRYWYRQK